MAFDQTTRNRLQSFVSKARAILSEEFTRQLQATYGLDPNQGTIADIESLSHLDNYQLQTAHILRDTVQHYMTTTVGKTQKEQVKLVLERIVREQAFTVLNRLAALRMAEARGFLLESIGSGYSSQGFQLYQMLEDGSHGETGDAYQSYLFSLFDEFGLDLAVLFDRFSVQGRLFPRETALLQLLEQINDYEIEPLWAEDETIGWIYQYFNSQEERKKMRSESSAPRNSRELAVRNQFFTPRYVVEFLTDNTLGRIWYEMTKGNTALVDSCQYLVKRPNEVFLSQGENSPIQNESQSNTEQEVLTQEEILKQTVYIPHRPLKDPRAIRMLDPACGSMHFGLYAFDLFEHIYLESWQIEAEQGADVFERESDLVSLHSTFEDIESFKQQIPKLIIEHNIHGVDIDPRAVQIAGLSLWQRAQRAWHEQGVKPNQRPTIVKSNIVCAEPMPGEQDLLKEFTSTLNPPALGQLVEVIFEKMALAGEAGTLLKIEQEIESAISKARQQWDETKDVNGGIRDLFEEELLAATPQKQLGFDLSGIDDETFWEDAEQLILQSLKDYSEQATSAAGEKRLFAEDTAKGFAFIDLSRKRFDVILMNPPFGEVSSNSEIIIRKDYPSYSKNILCAFFIRSSELINKNSYIGAIFDRTVAVKSSYEGFRDDYMSGNIDCCLDTGWGTLDANVETMCMVVMDKVVNRESAFIDLREMNNDESESRLPNITSTLSESLILVNPSYFSRLPNKVIGYDFPVFVIKAFAKLPSISSWGTFFEGHTLKSNRYFRCWWELDRDESIGENTKWRRLYNGGHYQRYNSHLSEVVKIGKEYEFVKYDKGSVLRNAKLQGKGLVGFGKRGEFVDAHIVPSGFISTVEGKHIILKDNISPYLMLSVLNSCLFQYVINLYCGQHKYPGYVSMFPVPENRSSDLLLKASQKAEDIFNLQNLLGSINENSLNHQQSEDFSILNLNIKNQIEEMVEKVESYEEEMNSNIYHAYALSTNDIKVVQGYCVKTSSQKHWWSNDVKQEERVISLVFGVLMGRFESSNKSEEISSALLTVKVSAENILHDDYPESWHLKEGVISLDDIGLDEEMELCFNYLSKGFKKEEVVSFNHIQKYISTSYESIKRYFESPQGFMNFHIDMYSIGSNVSPIYWPLQTASGSYTLWVYYHRLNSQTLYSCVNDFVEPKLALVTEDLNALSNKSNRSSIEEKELTKLTELQNDLKDFRDELLRLAKVWKPNLNDGVQITAAPLWKLFQHTAWQKKLKETWEKLEEGEYDWAHLAASIWPDRVLRKCHQDRSLAIAHDVEDLFWQEVEVPVMRGKKPTGKTKLEWQPIPASETTLNDMVNEAKARLQ